MKGRRQEENKVEMRFRGSNGGRGRKGPVPVRKKTSVEGKEEGGCSGPASGALEHVQ